MDLRRLRAGEWIAGVAGAVLLVSLFLPWYSGRESVSGWEALSALDVILAVVALSALAIPVATAAYRVPALPLALQSLTALVAIAALLLVIGRVLNMPGNATGREWGLWLGLVATLGVVAGGLIAMRDERRSPEGRHNDVTGVPVAGPPEIETLPAPPRGAGP